MARNRDTAVVDEAQTDEQTEEVGIVFEAPPTVTRSSDRDGKWDAKLAPLRENPGMWANLTPGGVENGNATTNFLKSGKAKGVSPQEFDFITRTVDDKQHVYGIFLTEEAQAEKAEYDRISSERRTAIKNAKEAGEELDRSALPDLPKRSYMP